MVLKSKVVTFSVVHVLVTVSAVVRTNLGITVILEFKDKAEPGACSVVEIPVTIQTWAVVAVSLLPGVKV